MESYRITHDPILCLRQSNQSRSPGRGGPRSPWGAGELAPTTRRKLLERLLDRGRFEDALLVLQPWLAEQPHSLNLALLSADLQRLTGNIDGAVSELKQLLSLHPLDAQVLQLLLLVEQTNGNGEQALNDLQKRLTANNPEPV